MFKIQESCTPTRVDEKKEPEIVLCLSDDARLGEQLTPLLYTDEGRFFVELKCDRGVCTVMEFIA